VLSFLSGKVFIYEGSQEVAQGSATLTQYGSESFLR
jgi:hypothetical protein